VCACMVLAYAALFISLLMSLVVAVAAEEVKGEVVESGELEWNIDGIIVEGAAACFCMCMCLCVTLLLWCWE